MDAPGNVVASWFTLLGAFSYDRPQPAALRTVLSAQALTSAVGLRQKVYAERNDFANRRVEKQQKIVWLLANAATIPSE